MVVIPLLGKLEQENWEFEPMLDNIVRFVSKTKQKELIYRLSFARPG